MSVRGEHVHLKIEQRLRTLEDDYHRLTAEITDSERRLQSLGSELELQYEKLARVYLPRLDREAAVLTQVRFPKMYERVAVLLAEKAGERNGLEEEQRQLRESRAKLASEFDRVTGDVETKVVERNALQRSVEGELMESARFLELKEAVDKARKNLDQWNRRRQRATAERESKLPAFESNELFAYLKRAGYGTSEHAGGVMVRWLDSLIAARVDYEKQKRAYDYLRDVESAMVAEVERAMAALEALETPLASRVHEASDRHGLSRVIAEGETLYRERVRVVESIEKNDGDARRVMLRLQELDSGQSDYHAKALDDYAEFLESQDGRRLHSVAEATRAQSDDDYVIVINRLEAELGDERRKHQLLVEDQVAIGDKVHRVRRLETRFRKKDYDASNSDFRDGFDIDEVLAAFVEGTLVLDELTDRMSRYQHFKKKRSSWSSSSSGSSWSSGGGFSSGSSFSSGGGFSSGGFSSGGGF